MNSHEHRAHARFLDTDEADFLSSDHGWMTMDNAPTDGRRVLLAAGDLVVTGSRIGDKWITSHGTEFKPDMWRECPRPPRNPETVEIHTFLTDISVTPDVPKDIRDRAKALATRLYTNRQRPAPTRPVPAGTLPANAN